MQEVREARSHSNPMCDNKLAPLEDVGTFRLTLKEDPLQPRRRALSPKERAVLDQQLDKWIRQGYIEPSRAWVSCNPVFVLKANGSIRTCIDYRPINRATRIWEWPLVRIRDIRHRLQGSRWYSRFDLKEAFHRIRIAPDTRPATAFATHRGIFQFTRMPFGLCTAPSTYQRFIDWVLRPVAGLCISYQDDILVYARSRAQARWRTAQVEKCLNDHQVEINEDKSVRLVQRVKYVGLDISEGRIGCALPIEPTALPVTKTDWLSALGFANCFRDYLPSFSNLTAGLYPGQNQLPPNERLAKFKILWSKLPQHLSLAHYADDRPGELFLDASKRAVGAVLCQSGKVCAIFSKGLSQSQQNYSATDREHLALMLGVEAFRVWIQSNQEITVNTDHTALLNRDETHMSSRQLRWKLRVEEITTNIKHVPGSDNPADFWSRQGWDGGGDNFYG